MSHTYYMSTLNLYPTSTASWQSLVQEAQNASRIELTEDLQSYLVFLLMRFLHETELTDKPIALEFLETLHQQGQIQQYNLREVGDKCLLISGFFPGLAQRRVVELKYYIDLGQGAYSALSYLTGKSYSELYGHLSKDFIPLVDILQTIRAMNTTEPELLKIHQACDRTRFVKIFTRQ
jgi:hypothetical protein